MVIETFAVRESDPTWRPYHAMPWKVEPSAACDEDPDDLPGGPWITTETRDLTICATEPDGMLEMT